MSTDTYQGWANRETWCLWLWISNNEGLYDCCRERVEAAFQAAYDDGADWQPTSWAEHAGQAVKDWWEEITDPAEQLMTPETIITITGDIDSLWRVDWQEIGEAALNLITDEGRHCPLCRADTAGNDPHENDCPTPNN